MIKKIALGLLAIGIVFGVVHIMGRSGGLGDAGNAGTIEGEARPSALTQRRIETQQQDTGTDQQILFGDLHVHTTFSGDAFLFAMPLVSGNGAHPVADACDFARYCSQLDFWSINDHAEYLTSSRWSETVDTIRACNAKAGDQANPDMVSYLGWEWTQVGRQRENHYGHKNVILADLDDDEIPDRPIASGLGVSGFAVSTDLAMMGFWMSGDKSYLDLAAYTAETNSELGCPQDVSVREMPAGCIDHTPTPDNLYAKLRDWGHRAIVIPHGTTWGLYTPQGASWDKQLQGNMHDPNIQTLIEVYSGHGNSEEYRDWKENIVNEDGSHTCPAPSEGYLPLCWRAGELMRDRCLTQGHDETTCNAKAAETKSMAANANAAHVWRVMQGTDLPDWLDAGQCTDCFLPSFNYVPNNAVQYILALTNFDDPNSPRRFRFGMMGSSDIHTARPGTGYKEYWREETTESNGIDKDAPGWYKALNTPTTAQRTTIEPFPLTEDTDLVQGGLNGQIDGVGSSLYTGGLIAVHADGRDRNAIWSGMQDKNVYSTSGPRVLMWFDAEMPNGDTLPMGSQITASASPTFTVRAMGSFEQKPGCPGFVEDALSAERIKWLCNNECYNPSDVRRPITRIEIVRILPQATPDEPMSGLIADPWRTFECDDTGAGCSVSFTDDEFASRTRDAVYYARAIEAPSDAVNGDGLRCEFDADGNCVKTNPCYGSNMHTPSSDDCLGTVEERAWSSPIFVDHTDGVMASR